VDLSLILHANIGSPFRQIIQAYFSLLKLRSEQPGYGFPRIFPFSSHFFDKLKKEGITGVVRWHRKVRE